MSPTAFSNAYRARAEAYHGQLRDVQTRARTALQAGSLDTELAVFRSLRSITADAIGAFTKLAPPPNMAGQFDAVVNALDEQRSALDDVLDSATRGSAARLNNALQAYAAALARWQNSEAQIDRLLIGGPVRAGPVS